MSLDFLRDLILAIWALPAVKFIVLHVLVNVVAAVAAALHTGTFQLSKISEFLFRKLLPYVLIYAVIQLAGETTGLAALGPVVWAVITAALLGDLVDSLAQLGIQLPARLARIAVKPAFALMRVRDWKYGRPLPPEFGESRGNKR